MRIKNIQLKNFRNYENEIINFSDGLNFIVGENAQGKTNLLESIYFCAIGKSPKTNKEKLLIRNEQTTAKINLDFDFRAGDKKIEIVINPSIKKAVKINGISILKLSQLIGEFQVVYFSPDELKLIKEVPEDRRRFLDIAISQFDKIYLSALLKYEKALKQRNAILKLAISDKSKLDQLDLFTPQLIQNAKIIIEKRLYFINLLKPLAHDLHKRLTDNEELDIEYSYHKKENVTIEDDLKQAFEKNKNKELELGFTLVGPHRDDLIFKINNKDCRYYSSQGQQRTVALSLKLANMEIINMEIGEYPVLLLDDVMSELDEKRRKRLLNITAKYQTLISCTEINDKFSNYNKIRIAKGKVL